MKYRNIIGSIVLSFVTSVAFISCNNGDENNKDATSDSTAAKSDVAYALPFKLEFVQKQYPTMPPLPRLQSYSVAMSKQGYLIISGGRRQGLHTFQSAPVKNFIPDSANNFIYLIYPGNGLVKAFDVNTLAPNLSAPLQSTNQQFYYDGDTDQMYLIGGYGWNAQKTNMLTFPTIMRYNVTDMANALLQSTPPTPQQITSLIQVSQDERYAVTGGALFKLGAQFYLVFGQRFDGQYRAFGGTDFKQKYTEEVRVFTLKPNSLQILRYGATTNTESDQPFHRRDGNIVNDIDPVTGQERITSFGGVFMPGKIAAYTYPIYITGPGTPTLDRNTNQKFSQYECPVISIHDSVRKNEYHTFFGGIGHYYYSQTPSQKSAYDTVTKEGRNDGFPFVADVTTFMERSDATYSEFIQLSPTTSDNRLIGASVNFIVNRALIGAGYAYSNGVIKLAKVDRRLMVGYIYGGIEAQNPLPLAANTGTFVSNSLFEVYLSPVTTQVLPASDGHESTKNDANLKRE